MTSPLRTVAAFAAFLVSSFTSATPAVAQDAMADIKRELAALRAEVQQLRGELDAVKQQAPPAPASLEILQTQVAELAQTRVESTSRAPVKLFGTVHGHFFTNSGNANWLDIPNLTLPAAAATPAGTTGATLRQTRIGLTVDAPRIGRFKTSGVVAMDFFGGVPGFQTGQVMGLARLLVGYARIEGEKLAVEVGQDQMILAPRDPSSLAGFAFPLLFRSGNLYLRTPQARIEYEFLPHLRATGGIVAPVGGDFTGTEYLFVPPALGGERSRRPGVQARLAYTNGRPDAVRFVEVGVSGHAGWERQAADLADSWAGAIDFAARRNWFGTAGELFTGDNADAFGGGLGLNARSAGGWAEVQVFPSNRLRLTTGFGVDDLRDDRALTLPRRENRSLYSGLMFSLTPEVSAGFEYRTLRTLSGQTSSTNHHFDWVLTHSF
jgi:hypothetical protein